MIRLFACLTFMIAAVSPVSAQNGFVNLLEGYTIEADVLDAPNCQDPSNVPIEDLTFGDKTIRSFEQGICEFHRPARSPAQTDRAILLLDTAQISGLPPVHQQLAGLLTGLAQCNKADLALQTLQASGQTDLLAREAFCFARRAARAELNGVRWDVAMFDYAEGLSAERRLSARLTEMSACYSGALSSALDSECGELTNPSTTEIEAVAQEAADAMIVTFFTGVESPATAMFQRKTERAEGVLERAEEGIGELETRAAGVNAEFDSYDGRFVAARDTVMNPIYVSYREAILQATQILDEYERWKGGLFLRPDGTNMLPLIQQRSEDVTGELERVTQDDFTPRAEAVLENLRSSLDQERVVRDTAANLCRIYFCELLNQQNFQQTIQVCRRPSLDSNPLCLTQAGAIQSDTIEVDFGGTQSIAIADLCRGAGVDDIFLRPQLPLANARTCLGAIE